MQIQTIIFPYLWCVLFGVFYTTIVQANSDTILLDENFQIHSDQSAISYTEDIEGILTSDSFIEQSVSLIRNDTKTLNFGFQHNPYWFTFHIKNESEGIKNLVLALEYPLLDHIKYYEIESGQVERTAIGGRLLDHENWELDLLNPSFRLEILPKTTKTILICIQTEGSFIIPIHLYDQFYFAEVNQGAAIWFGLLYGIFVIMVIYNAFLFTVTKDKIFLFFAAYIFFFGLYLFAMNGLAHLYFFRSNVKIAHQFMYYVVFPIYGFQLMFARSYLRVKDISIQLDKYFIIGASICGFLALSSFFLDYKVTANVSSICFLFVSVFTVYAAFRCINKGIWYAQIYMLAVSIVIIGAALYILTVRGVLNYTAFTMHAMEIAMVFEISLFSVGLGSRIEALNKEHQKERKNRQFLEQLNTINQSVASSLQVEPIAEALLDGLSKFTPFHEGLVFLYQKETQKFESILPQSDLSIVNNLRDKAIIKTWNQQLLTQNNHTPLLNIYKGKTVYLPLVFQQTLNGYICLEKTNKKIINKENTDLLQNILQQGSVSLQHAFDYQALQHNKNQLQKVNKELEHFTSIVSHDLRAPLSTAKRFAELLETRHGDQLDKRGKEFVRFIIDGVERMHLLVVNLLKYAQVGENEAIKPIKLDNIIQVATNNLYAMTREQEATIEIIPTNLIIKGNRTPLIQLFQNLISNSIKYKKVNLKPIIKVGVVELKGVPTIYISDNGIGIKPAHHESIFKMFNQLNPQDDKDSNSGVGLAICQKAVEQHEGKIWVESEEGKGATFYIQLARMEKIAN